MLLYCRLIAALKIRTSNKKHKHLSTQACINILEEHGVETDNTLIKVQPGTLKKAETRKFLQGKSNSPRKGEFIHKIREIGIEV